MTSFTKTLLIYKSIHNLYIAMGEKPIYFFSGWSVSLATPLCKSIGSEDSHTVVH